jgi:hypothetical protein
VGAAPAGYLGHCLARRSCGALPCGQTLEVLEWSIVPCSLSLRFWLWRITPPHSHRRRSCSSSANNSGGCEDPRRCESRCDVITCTADPPSVLVFQTSPTSGAIGGKVDPSPITGPARDHIIGCFGSDAAWRPALQHHVDIGVLSCPRVERHVPAIRRPSGGAGEPPTDRRPLE